MVKITEANKKMIHEHVSIMDLAKDYFDVIREGKYYKIKDPSRLGSGERDLSSIRIYPETNTYFRWSDRTKGDVINFVMETEIEGIRTFPEACLFLMKRVDPDITINISHTPVEKKILPIEETHKSLLSQLKLDETNKFIIAYLLNKRKLDKDIVYEGIKNRYIVPIYENNNHSLGFLGYSELGTLCAGFVRGIKEGSTFKKDFTDNDYSRGWTWYPRNEQNHRIIPDHPTVIICEGYISMLSYMSLLKNNDSNYRNYVYHCTGSATKWESAINIIEKLNPEKTIVATDNDKAGELCYSKIIENFEGKDILKTIVRDTPTLNDWNDDLVELKKYTKDIDSRKSISSEKTKSNYYRKERTNEREI